jgi:hypothetical protein
VIRSDNRRYGVGIEGSSLITISSEARFAAFSGMGHTINRTPAGRISPRQDARATPLPSQETNFEREGSLAVQLSDLQLKMNVGIRRTAATGRIGRLHPGRSLTFMACPGAGAAAASSLPCARQPIRLQSEHPARTMGLFTRRIWPHA